MPYHCARSHFLKDWDFIDPYIAILYWFQLNPLSSSKSKKSIEHGYLRIIKVSVSECIPNRAEAVINASLNSLLRSSYTEVHFSAVNVSHGEQQFPPGSRSCFVVDSKIRFNVYLIRLRASCFKLFLCSISSRKYCSRLRILMKLFNIVQCMCLKFRMLW